MKLFTLIHVCSEEESMHNSRAKTFDHQIYLYLVCAQKLHYSLRQENLELSIITNNKAYLARLFPTAFDIEVIELKFSLNVPSGIKFYSAHFKLEVFEFLANRSEPYVGLLDSDILCVNKMPRQLKNIIELGLPMYYDITDQTAPAYGFNTLISDKEKLSENNSIGLWAGGEFISGPPSFFERLYSEVKRISSSYFANFHSFHHQGDEVITSVAIENLIVNEQLRIIDAGTLNIIGRFWSVNTLHSQKPIHAYFQHFLLHLPADKQFITSLKDQELATGKFFTKYSRYLIKRGFRKAVSKLIRSKRRHINI